LPVATAFNLPPLPPIPAQAETQAAPVEPSASAHFAEAASSDESITPHAPEAIQEHPVEPVIVPVPVVEAVAPVIEEAQQHAPVEAPASLLPTQGDLLSHATTTRPAAPMPAALTEHAPPADASSSKDASQG
jgi:ribonuclease E